MNEENNHNDRNEDKAVDFGDKAEKIRSNIKSTLYNMEATEDVIAQTPNNKIRRELEEKNKRRAEALPSMVKQMKEEEAKKELGLSD
ncbi:MAG: small acid-soluble spore protein Tlp [Oscillospiraceae bacterium]|nr:small acid-soluble spore protein Tlp [Oscillospiraceae bacterium]